MPLSEANRRPEYLKAVLEVLNEAGGELPARDVFSRVSERVGPTVFELERHAKTGYVRWWAALNFDSVRLVKAGWVRKKRRIWFLTEEGRKQIGRSADEVFRDATRHYQSWRSVQELPEEGESDDIETSVAVVTFEQAQQLAESGIRDHLAKMSPYEFQDFVAALLRGMGYHTSFVAPPGKDGGIDIQAYRDPFGSVEPRLKVQVKHRAEEKVNAREVREHVSLLNKQGDAGLFVSFAGFTSDAKTELRRAQVHIEMVDLDKLIEHWQTYYDKLSEDDKYLMPLRRIAFLAPESD